MRITVSTTDLALGSRTYIVDALGEVTAYTDSNNNSFSATYDAAIMRVDIPTSALGNFYFSNSIDPFIFRSGVLTIEGTEQMNLFNSVISNIGHAY